MLFKSTFCYSIKLASVGLIRFWPTSNGWPKNERSRRSLRCHGLSGFSFCGRQSRTAMPAMQRDRRMVGVPDVTLDVNAWVPTHGPRAPAFREDGGLRVGPWLAKDLEELAFAVSLDIERDLPCHAERRTGRPPILTRAPMRANLRSRSSVSIEGRTPHLRGGFTASSAIDVATTVRSEAALSEKPFLPWRSKACAVVIRQFSIQTVPLGKEPKHLRNLIGNLASAAHACAEIGVV